MADHIIEPQEKPPKQLEIDLEIKDAQLIFDSAWNDLVADIGEENMEFPRECFWLNQHTVRSAVGASGCGSQTTDWWECGRRDQTGCPKNRPIAESPYYRKRRGAWEARS